MTNLDERYFEWLVRQVKVENRRRNYHEVLWLMFNYEFVWLVPNDDNRLMDGLELRHEFDSGYNPAVPCSVLEVMIALSRRMEFIVGGKAPNWAWQFMLNLGLEKMIDPLSRYKQDQVGEILEALVYRTYSPSGEGGFFPLQEPDDDQTRIEIWYQMAAYVGEILPD